MEEVQTCVLMSLSFASTGSFPSLSVIVACKQVGVPVHCSLSTSAGPSVTLVLAGADENCTATVRRSLHLLAHPDAARAFIFMPLLPRPLLPCVTPCTCVTILHSSLFCCGWFLTMCFNWWCMSIHESSYKRPCNTQVCHQSYAVVPGSLPRSQPRLRACRRA